MRHKRFGEALDLLQRISDKETEEMEAHRERVRAENARALERAFEDTAKSARCSRGKQTPRRNASKRDAPKPCAPPRASGADARKRKRRDD